MNPQVFRSQEFSGAAPRDSRDFPRYIYIDCVFRTWDCEGGVFNDATFVNCEFTDVNFYWAHFQFSVFVGCKLTRVDFRGAMVVGAIFSESGLQACDFGKDNLGGVTDVGGTTFSNCEIIECIWSPEEEQKAAQPGATDNPVSAP